MPLGNPLSRVWGMDMSWGFRWTNAKNNSKLACMGHESMKRLRRHSLLSWLSYPLFCGLFYPCIYSFSCLCYTRFSSPFIYPFYLSHENLTKNHFPLGSYSYVFLLMVIKNAGSTKSFWLPENHTARNEIFKKRNEFENCCSCLSIWKLSL